MNTIGNARPDARHIHPLWKTLFLIPLLLALAACGGGGDSVAANSGSPNSAKALSLYASNPFNGPCTLPSGNGMTMVGFGSATSTTSGNCSSINNFNDPTLQDDTGGVALTNIYTWAGTGTAGYVDGLAARAQFTAPTGMAVDADGNVYVADKDSHRIRRIDIGGIVATVAGSGSTDRLSGGFKDGPATSAIFNMPAGLVFDAAGNLYITDVQNQRIRKLDKNGNVSTFAGSGQFGGRDGPAASAQFASPFGIAIDAASNLYVTDSSGDRIRKITPDGTVSTVAGTGQRGYLDGPTANAQFSGPQGIAVNPSGTVMYIADYYNNRIRKVDARGVTTLAGTGMLGYLNGPAASAQFASPTGVALDANGNLYVSDQNNNSVRQIDPSGNVTTLAGPTINRDAGFQDGSLSDARFNRLDGITLDASGNLYIADRDNFAVRSTRMQPWFY